MTMNISTPALLFPAISLLLLAYTNRFLALGSRIRALHSDFKQQNKDSLKKQIDNLKKRVVLIRNMQLFGITSLFMCVFSMLAMYFDWETTGQTLFGGSLILMLCSLATSMVEIYISVEALNIHLADAEPDHNKTCS